MLELNSLQVTTDVVVMASVVVPVALRAAL
jgi:hypothetical protein